jgi:hypothetical protein
MGSSRASSELACYTNEYKVLLGSLGIGPSRASCDYSELTSYEQFFQPCTYRAYLMHTARTGAPKFGRSNSDRNQTEQKPITTTHGFLLLTASSSSSAESTQPQRPACITPTHYVSASKKQTLLVYSTCDSEKGCLFVFSSQ